MSTTTTTPETKTVEGVVEYASGIESFGQIRIAGEKYEFSRYTDTVGRDGIARLSSIGRLVRAGETVRVRVSYVDVDRMYIEASFGGPKAVTLGKTQTRVAHDGVAFEVLS